MKKKRNKKAIIITAALMLAGILAVLAGFFGSAFVGLFISDYDFANITPEDLGKEIRTDIQVEYDVIDLADRSTQMVGDLNGEYNIVLLDLSALSDEKRSDYFTSLGRHVTIRGTLRAMEDAEYREIEEKFYEHYDPIYYRRVEEGAWTNVTLEDFHQRVIGPLIPYCVDVTSISAFNWFPFIPAGILIFLVSLVLLICFVFKLKKRIVLPVVFGIMILVPVILLYGHIRTMLTVRKISPGLYTMKNIECTDTQGMLDSGSSSINEFLQWILDEHLYGAPNIFEDHFSSGCAAFAAESPEGDHLFGRNFDYPETDTLIIYSHPEGAYESVGIADLTVLGVGQSASVSPDSPLGRLVMVVTPYMVVDGMNEKGVGAGILQLSIEETHQDNGKPDLLIFCAIRAILDNCASVDEALDLLSSYDIHSDGGTDYHLFITDRSGRYVVVEWLGGEMTVVEHPCCTNTVIAPGDYYNMGTPDDRLPTLEACLDSERILTESEAMAALEEIKNPRITEWSCVYNLDDFTFSICLDTDYDTVYTYSVEDLR